LGQLKLVSEDCICGEKVVFLQQILRWKIAYIYTKKKNGQTVLYVKKIVYICIVNYILSMNKKTKINTLIQSLPRGSVLLPSWLLSQGYSYELQQSYRKSNWLKSIGKGAMLKSGDPLVLTGALSALQNACTERSRCIENLNIHIGGRSALELQGVAHYLQINNPEITLFVNSRKSLPVWFTNNDWNAKIKLFRLSLFDDETLGMTDFQEGELTMKISNPARAIMECLALCPEKFPLPESFELMEGLASLRPAKIQELLESCKSIKVKRLFLCFAEKANHSWFKYLDTNKIDLGVGNRSLVESGVLVSKYKLVLPIELA
jgi:hypothetical protein